MNWMYQSCQYLSSLKDKGFADEDFNNEYQFVMYERFKIHHPEFIPQINSLQAKTLLQRENLK